MPSKLDSPEYRDLLDAFKYVVGNATSYNSEALELMFLKLLIRAQERTEERMLAERYRQSWSGVSPSYQPGTH